MGDAQVVDAVRRYGGEGVRVTIGEEAANSRLLEITGRLRSALRT